MFTASEQPTRCAQLTTERGRRTPAALDVATRPAIAREGTLAMQGGPSR